MSRAGPHRSAPVTVITALAAEGRTLNRAQARVRHIVCGPGPAAARRATLTALPAAPAAIVSWGVAGALSRGFAAGDIFRPDTVVSADGQVFVTSGPGRDGSRLVSVDAPVRTHKARLELAARSGAGLVDMESGSIAEVCAAARIPFQCVRAVADGVDDLLPDWVDDLMTPAGDLAAFSAVLAILRHPGSLPALLRTGAGFRRALKALEQAARSHPWPD